LVVGIGESAIEPALLAGGIRCPDCEARLAPWGHAREREVRMRYGGRLLRPRRGRCGRCDSTHVLLPATVVPRRRDCTQVIAQALFAAAGGSWSSDDRGRAGSPAWHRPRLAARVRPSCRGADPLRLAVGRSRSARSPRADGRPSRRWPMVSRRSAGPTRGMWRASAARRTSGSCSSRCAAAIYCTAAPAIRRTFLDALRRPVAPADRGSASTVDTSRLSGP